MTTENERAERKLLFLQWGLGVFFTAISLFAGASIPWAFAVQADVATIKSRLENLVIPPEWFRDDVRHNTNTLTEIEIRLRKLEARSKPE